MTDADLAALCDRLCSDSTMIVPEESQMAQDMLAAVFAIRQLKLERDEARADIANIERRAR